ncbi:hypothetical protein ACWDRB_63730 [Nonomuraea sp. NPDC003707]
MPLPPKVPHRRMVDLARYGMQATATTLRRHGPSRQLATLLATVIYLEGKAADDCLEMLDLLVTTELVGKAETAPDKEQVRWHPKLAKHSATLAAAVDTLLEVTEYGEELRLDQVWEAIDVIVPTGGVAGGGRGGDRDGAAARRRGRRRDAGAADHTDRHVSGFLKTLTTVIDFGASIGVEQDVVVAEAGAAGMRADVGGLGAACAQEQRAVSAGAAVGQAE